MLDAILIEMFACVFAVSSAFFPFLKWKRNYLSCALCNCSATLVWLNDDVLCLNCHLPVGQTIGSLNGFVNACFVCHSLTKTFVW